MKLIDIASDPWAIQPDKLNEIMSIYDAHLKREKIDLVALEQRLGKPLGSKDQGYELKDGVAIIDIDGVICRRANLMSKISGGCSTELAMNTFKEAMEDGSVDAIVLDIDSPGGSVAGTQEFANAVFSARGVKPVYAVASGQMCSAAYWIGAACEKILVTEETTSVGSIGVVAQHIDVSSANKKEGIKKTEIFAGKYKRIASENEPLSKDGKGYIQEKVDYLYSIFVADIARFRGVSEEEVLTNMADGRVFIGKQAIDAGLVDGVSTFDTVVDELAGGVLSNGTKLNKMENGNMSDETITRDILAKDHPELFDAIKSEGAAAELERVQSVFAATLPGHEQLIEALAFDGKTTGAEAALAVVKAEKDTNAARLAAMQDDANQDSVDASVEDEEATVEKSFDELVAEAKDGGMTQAQAVRSVVDANPSAYDKYLKGLEA